MKNSARTSIEAHPVIDILHKRYPELIGILVTVTGVIFACFDFYGLERQAVANVASLAVQLQATYLGLVLTAYTVFQSLRINTPGFVDGKKLTSEQAAEVKEILGDLHDQFIENMWVIGVSVLFALLLYLIATIETENRSYADLFESQNSHIWNALAGCVALGFATASTFCIIESAKILHALRSY